MSPDPENPQQNEVLYDPFLVAAPKSTGTVQRETRRHRVVLSVALSALVTALCAVGLLVYGAFHWRNLLDREAAPAEEDDGGTKRAGLPAEPDEPQEPEADKREPPDPTDVLQDTETQLRGAVEVVDVGVSSGSLLNVLETHAAIAETKGQRLLVMTTGRRCTPCTGVDDALSHPLMQAALKNVRLVRVDLDVFGDELKQLKMPTNLFPAFFLLGPDNRPIDAIHGGEWDDDVAENIAPVLGAFVRGEYKKRRHAEWSPTTTSVPL